MSTSFISPTPQRKKIPSTTDFGHSIPKIHIFNPDTDLALASGLITYTPPGGIAAFQKQCSLLPALWAERGDFVVTHYCSNPEKLIGYDIAEERGVNIISLENVPPECKHLPVIPWGWNSSLASRLIRAGFCRSVIPSKEKLSSIRTLSHRRISITFHELLNQELHESGILIPREIDSPEEVVEAVNKWDNVYLKAPWSSSGKGVIFANRGNIYDLSQRVAAIIRRQGSIMVEKAEPRSLDFASEWIIDDGNALFQGWSLFETDSEGSYKGNIIASQEKLTTILSAHIPFESIKRIQKAQKYALDTLVAPYYSGPVGVDMLMTEDGRINPCVEINLRHTMGLAALLINRRSEGLISGILRVPPVSNSFVEEK